jgi:methylmalonyl-CoA/ethylmalonyl-CoA epimerase
MACGAGDKRFAWRAGREAARGLQISIVQAQHVDFFGSGATFHHVGLAVESIDAAQAGLTKFHDPIQKVVVAFMEVHGAMIELIEPAGGGSPVSASLAKGIQLLHLCYEVPNLEQAIASAGKHGLRLIARPAPAVAFDQRRIAWLFHQRFGVFELLEAARR